MSTLDDQIGRDYTKLLNRIARDINGLVDERKRLIKLMENTGWMIYESRREEGKLSSNYAPTIKSVTQMKKKVLEVE